MRERREGPTTRDTPASKINQRGKQKFKEGIVRGRDRGRDPAGTIRGAGWKGGREGEGQRRGGKGE
jgi:hypothetical protein